MNATLCEVGKEVHPGNPAAWQGEMNWRIYAVGRLVRTGQVFWQLDLATKGKACLFGPTGNKGASPSAASD